MLSVVWWAHALAWLMVGDLADPDTDRFSHPCTHTPFALTHTHPIHHRGLRLTYNFWRKGGYAPGGEDYRWVRVREDMVEPWGPWAWPLFNVLFIAIFQNLLLLLIACPAYVAWVHRKDSPRMDTTGFTWDMVFVTLFALFLLVETVADEQQWRFQQAKKAAMSRRPVRAAARRASLASATGKARVAAKEGAAAPLLEGELLDGFCQSGLFRFRCGGGGGGGGRWWWCLCVLSCSASGISHTQT